MSPGTKLPAEPRRALSVGRAPAPSCDPSRLPDSTANERRVIRPTHHLSLVTSFREDVEARGVSALPDHHAALVLDDDLPVLVQAARAHLDDALLGARLRLAHLHDLALRVERVAGEEGVGQLDPVPAE